MKYFKEKQKGVVKLLFKSALYKYIIYFTVSSKNDGLSNFNSLLIYDFLVSRHIYPIGKKRQLAHVYIISTLINFISFLCNTAVQSSDLTVHLLEA